MENANVIDLAARRAERRNASKTLFPTDAPPTLEERQRETIAKLRALGYEMCHKAPGRA